MLYPKIELCKKPTYCTCGNPNFRHNYESYKPIYDIYEVTIPTVPCGSETFRLCADCLKLLQPPNEPLTLEQLKQRDGEPVWLKGNAYAALCYLGEGTIGHEQDCFAANYFGIDESEFLDVGDYNKTWFAYRQKPKEDD